MADFWSQFQEAPAPTLGGASGLMGRRRAPTDFGPEGFLGMNLTPDQRWARSIDKMEQLRPGSRAEWDALPPEEQARIRAEASDPNRAISVTGRTTQPAGAPIERQPTLGGAVSGGPVSSTRSPGVRDASGNLIIPGGSPFPNDPTVTNDPVTGFSPGYSNEVQTGGGQYPLSSFEGVGLNRPWTTPYVAPNDVTYQNDPGYQARMRMGVEALDRSAASRGTLKTGAHERDLTAYGQDYGSSEYDKVYGRALGEYQQAYGIYDRNQANVFGREYQLASMGQNAAAGAGNAASSYANNAGDLITNQANSNANQIVNTGNAINNGVTTLGAIWPDKWNNGRPGATAPTPR